MYLDNINSISPSEHVTTDPKSILHGTTKNTEPRDDDRVQ